MNAALMLCGHFRNLPIPEPYWHEFVANNNCDIFISTWDNVGNRSNSEWVASQDDKLDFEKIINILKPKKYLIENMNEVNRNLTLKRNNNSLWFLQCNKTFNHPDFSTYILSQIYKIGNCFKLIEDHTKETGKKYDLVFKVRADTFPENFNIDNYKKIKHIIEDKVLFSYYSSNHRHLGGGGGCVTCSKEYNSHKKIRQHIEHTNDICDYFNYGNYEVMKKLASIYDNVHEIYEKMEKHNLSVYNPADKEIGYDPKTNKYLVLDGHMVIENKYKCIYPEKFIREFMQDEWIIHDPIKTHIVFDKFDINSYDLKKAISNDKKQKMLNSTRIINKSKLKFL